RTKPTTGGIPVALLLAMRPKQWTKNLFVFVAYIFTIPDRPDDARWRALGIAALAFLLFCLVSGAIYLMNDVFDREQDRLHPEKRKRPIASGRLPVSVAIPASAALGIGGTAAGFLINSRFGVILTGYLLLQIAYTFVLKHMV